MLMSKKVKVRAGKGKQRPPQATVAPVATGSRQVTKPPRVVSTNGGCVITHSEPITGVISTANVDTILSYSINPGDAVTFPWLGQIANAWDFYQIRSLRYRFVSRLPSTTYGTIVLSIEYDVLDAVPTNLIEMRQMSGSVSGNGWLPLSINWTSSGVLMGSGSRKTRISSSPADNLTDVGRLIVGSNVSTSQVCGEIWADYTVALFKPQQVPMVETYTADFPGVSEVPVLTPVNSAGKSFFNLLAGSLISTTSNLPVSVVPSPVAGTGLALRIRLPWLLQNRDVHISLTNRTVFNREPSSDVSTEGVSRPSIYVDKIDGTSSFLSTSETDAWIAEFLSDSLVLTALAGGPVIGVAVNRFMSFHLRLPNSYVYQTANVVAITIVFYFTAWYFGPTAVEGNLFALLGSDVHVDPGPKELTPNDFTNLPISSFTSEGKRYPIRDAPEGVHTYVPSPSAYRSSGSYLTEPRVSKDTQSTSCRTDQIGSTAIATENSPTLETQRPTLCPCCNRT